MSAWVSRYNYFTVGVHMELRKYLTGICISANNYDSESLTATTDESNAVS